MVLGVGVVHPPGERAPDYDGVYFRRDEMAKLAADLHGKPLCVEHHEGDPVGTVRRAWVGRQNRLFVLFETDDETFKGTLAGQLVDRRICTDLSLGHRVAYDPEAHRVLGKTPVEVSLCTQGARPGTHIYAVRSSRDGSGGGGDGGAARDHPYISVSYTHLTLATISSV